MTIAKVEKVNGSPAITVNGEVYPPMLMTTECDNAEYLRKMGKAGLKIFYVVASTNWNQPGDPNFVKPKKEWAYFIRPDMGTPGETLFLRDMATLFEAVPDAYVFLRLNVSPSVEWVNAHPDEQVKYSDGKQHPMLCTSVSRYDEIDGMHSLCSDVWRKEAMEAVNAFFDMLENTAYFDRVIGVFLCAGGTFEWYYPKGMLQEDGVYGDLSEPFRKEYEKFLREKYGTEEALRAAWGRQDATFAHPIIPDAEDRYFVQDADQEIVRKLEYWLIKRPPKEQKAEHDAADGIFLNMNTAPYVADYYAAWNKATANTIIIFADFIKKRYPGWLVGAFYGSYGCNDFFDNSTSTGTLDILDSGVVDFLAAPGVYNNREPGGIVALREMQDSFRIRNCIYINEDDTRTHLCNPEIQRVGHGLFSVQDSVNTLKRDFARDLCEDIYGWWFDMGGDWFDDPTLMRLLSRQQEIAKAAYRENRQKNNEIALMYDTESVHMVSLYTSQRVCDYYRSADLGRIGAPVDYYFHNDMARDDVPDYKMYVMLNQYCLTDAEREAIIQKAKKNHALVLWLYAPGFIDPEKAEKMAVSHISDTVGMKVVREEGVRMPHFRLNPYAHPITQGMSGTKDYGILGHNVRGNNALAQTVVKADFLTPAFCIDDENATVLGNFCDTGKPAMAITEKDGYASVYCAAQVIGSDLLAALAKYAGCHLYGEQDDVIYANEHFLAIHAKEDGERTLHFKKPCTPYEVYEKREYGKGVDSITVRLQKGETKMWHLDGDL